MQIMLFPTAMRPIRCSNSFMNRRAHIKFNVRSPKFDDPQCRSDRVAVRNRAREQAPISCCSGEVRSGKQARSEASKNEPPSSRDEWWCGSDGDGNEAHANMAMPKSDLESFQWLRPSIDKQNGLATGNGSIATCRPMPQSTSNHHHHHSAASVLANAVPSSLAFDADFDNSTQHWTIRAETRIERAIFDFRFLSLLAVVGSLAGSFLCFVKGCVYIVESYGVFYMMCLNRLHTGNMVLRLVEAVDVFLTGTVMLIFGMGVYGLFISNVPNNLPPNQDRAIRNSSLFGMFLLKERPKWMRIGSLDELKTKLGHVVVMILLVKMFERSKAVSISTGTDLLSYSISIFLSSAALLVLHKLHH